MGNFGNLRPIFIEEVSKLGLEKQAISVRKSIAARLARFIRPKGLEGLPKEVEKGLRTQSIRESGGPRSFLMWIPRMVTEKSIGRKKVRSGMWKKIDKPIHNINISGGQSMSALTRRVPGLKSLFYETQKIPVKMPGQKNLYREVKIPALTAPASKAMSLATPIVVGVSLEKGVGKLKQFREQKKQQRALKQYYGVR